MWIFACLNEQPIPVMLDTGATPSCIALRCITANAVLSKLPRKPYLGLGITAANGENLQPDFIVTVTVTMGNPTTLVNVDILVIKNLPYSCIFGQNLLQLFDTWTVCNVNRIISVNASKIPFHTDPFDVSMCLNFVAATKTPVPPHKTVLVSAHPIGNLFSPYRPVSRPLVSVKPHEPTYNRLNLQSSPAVFAVSHQNCSIQIAISNMTDHTTTIGKGTKLAFGNCMFDIIPFVFPDDFVNVLSTEMQNTDFDPVTHLLQKLTHLPWEDYCKASSMLSDFKDIFSIGNDKIGQARNIKFDIDTNIVSPVAVLLRHVPMQHQSIISDLIE